MTADDLREMLGIPRNDDPALAQTIELYEFVTGARLDKIDGGYRVKTVGNYHVDVLSMIFNWRISVSHVDAPGWPVRGWCYQGTGLAGLLPCALAAIVWDGMANTEPPGYFKRAGEDIYGDAGL